MKQKIEIRIFVLIAIAIMAILPFLLDITNAYNVLPDNFLASGPLKTPAKDKEPTAYQLEIREAVEECDKSTTDKEITTSKGDTVKKTEEGSVIFNASDMDAAPKAITKTKTQIATEVFETLYNYGVVSHSNYTFNVSPAVREGDTVTEYEVVYYYNYETSNPDGTTLIVCRYRNDKLVYFIFS